MKSGFLDKGFFLLVLQEHVQNWQSCKNFRNFNVLNNPIFSWYLLWLRCLALNSLWPVATILPQFFGAQPRNLVSVHFSKRRLCRGLNGAVVTILTLENSKYPCVSPLHVNGSLRQHWCGLWHELQSQHRLPSSQPCLCTFLPSGWTAHYHQFLSDSNVCMFVCLFICLQLQRNPGVTSTIFVLPYELTNCFLILKLCHRLNA